MNIRIRKHNDDPNLVVVELIVDDKVMDDIVCGISALKVAGATARMINSYAFNVDYEDGLDDHEQRVY